MTLVPAAKSAPSSALIFVLALACGITVANLYYAQPLIGAIGESFAMSVETSALVVTMLQLGYVAGMLFLAPLGDLIESRRLIVTTLIALGASCLAAAAAPTSALFIGACLLVGVTTSAVQMLIPLAAHLSPEESRGRIVGTVMSGLLFGILLARPVSTLVAGFTGWRGVFVMSALAGAATIAMLVVMLPRHVPKGGIGYARLISSLWPILRDTRVLQRRGFYQACMFAAFSIYWTAIPLVLQQPPFSLGHVALSLFMLSGAAGAFVAPYAGRLADKGYSRIGTISAFTLVALGFALAYFGARSIVMLALAGIVIDAGVQANMVIGQRAIYSLAASIRSRLNALYLSILFLGGAVGSALAGFAFARGGLALVCLIGVAFPAMAALVFASEFLRRE